MEGRGSAVLVAPFGDEALPWRGGKEEEEEQQEEEELGANCAAGDEEQQQQQQEEAEAEEAERRELRRRRGRSRSLPSSPTLPSARLFPPREGDEGQEGEGEGGGGCAPSRGCCAKCKKRVQFADALGLCLARVKHFSAAEEPRVPPAALSRLQSFPMRQKDLEEFSAALAELGASLRAPSSSSSPPPPPLLLEPPRAPLPGPPPPGRVRVRLEEASGSCVGGAPSEAQGLVRVQGGPAAVSVRYTFNEWRSFLDADAAPLADGERFRFRLCLPPGLEEGTAVRFAVCCRGPRGEEHWDNNGGANYTLRPAAPAAQEQSD